MSQKAKLLELFRSRLSVSEKQAKQAGINNFRQQVYFLRQDEYKIINTNTRTYRLL